MALNHLELRKSVFLREYGVFRQNAVFGMIKALLQTSGNMSMNGIIGHDHWQVDVIESSGTCHVTWNAIFAHSIEDPCASASG